MTIRDIAPWKWGGLRRGEPTEMPFGGFRWQMDMLHKDMDRLFDDMMDRPTRPFLTGEFWDRKAVMPDIDETEDEKAFIINVELPGMDEKDVDITLSGRLLTIRGEKKVDEKEEDKDFYRRERKFGAFRRTLELPGEVDEKAIEASFRKGVLTIHLPKTKEAKEKVRHIAVKAA